MEALVYTKDDSEYEKIRTMLEAEAGLIDVYRDPLNGHNYFSHEYDIVVVALNGARGMELVLEYSRRFDMTLVVWITDDPYFAGTAIREHIYDFIERPYDDDRLRETIRAVIPRCPNRYKWVYDPDKEERIKRKWKE